MPSIREATVKATVKRGSKKRLKSAKEVKRDVGKAARSRKDYPITETLQWVADGEMLLRRWGAIKSPRAKKIAAGFEKILAVLETVDKVRKM
jgi:hypothetical protein